MLNGIAPSHKPSLTPLRFREKPGHFWSPGSSLAYQKTGMTENKSDFLLDSPRIPVFTSGMQTHEPFGVFLSSSANVREYRLQHCLISRPRDAVCDLRGGSFFALQVPFLGPGTPLTLREGRFGIWGWWFQRGEGRRGRAVGLGPRSACSRHRGNAEPTAHRMAGEWPTVTGKEEVQNAPTVGKPDGHHPLLFDWAATRRARVTQTERLFSTERPSKRISGQGFDSPKYGASAGRATGIRPSPPMNFRGEEGHVLHIRPNGSR